MQDNNVYHIADVGKMLGFTRQYVWELINDNVIIAYKNKSGIYEITQQEYERLRNSFYKNIETYSLSEVAKMLGVSRRGLLKKAIKGEIKAYPLPSIKGQKQKWVIPSEEFARLKVLKRQAKKTIKVTDLIK